MKTKTTERATYGQLVELLTRLGFTRRAINNDYELFSHRRSGMSFPLPMCDMDARARGTHIDGLRLQLDYRGLMEHAEFDAYFATASAAK